MNKKITFCDYIADKSPDQAYQVLKDSGLNFPKPKSNRQLAEMLKKYVKVDRAIALRALARIHPDRELIESLDREVRDADFEIKKAAETFGKNVSKQDAKLNACGSCGSYMNCCGSCSCGKDDSKLNFDGEKKSDNTALIVTLGFFTLLYLLTNQNK